MAGCVGDSLKTTAGVEPAFQLAVTGESFLPVSEFWTSYWGLWSIKLDFALTEIMISQMNNLVFQKGNFQGDLGQRTFYPRLKF